MSLPSKLRPQRVAFRWRSAARALVVAGMVVTSGCGTIFRDGVADISRPAPFYPAVHMDIGMIGGAVTRVPRTWGGWGEAVVKTVGGILDLPISLVTDTLLLPWDLRDYRRRHGSWAGEWISGAGGIYRNPETGNPGFWFDEYQYPGGARITDLPDENAGGPRHKTKGHLEAVLHWSKKDGYFIRWSEVRWMPQAPPEARKTADPDAGESKTGESKK